MNQTQPNNDKKKIPWVRILGTVAALGLLVYLVISQGWQALLDSLAEVSWPGFLLALGLILLSRFSTVGRWHVLLRSADVPIRLRQSLELVFAGLFSANFLPTTVGGDLVRLAGAVRWGYDGAVVAASLVMDRLVGMAGMATVLPFGLASFLSQPLPLPKSTLAAGAALAAAVPGRVVTWVKEKLGKLWESLRRAARRGLWDVESQVYLTATVQNLKRLAALCRARQATVGYGPSSGRPGPRICVVSGAVLCQTAVPAGGF